MAEIAGAAGVSPETVYKSFDGKAGLIKIAFDHALAGARNSPGGCVQVVVDPQTGDGNLFNYGFFPIAGDYCS